MAMNGTTLATAIKGALGFGALATSAKNTAFANAIVAHVQTGIVAFAPGTITGNAPSSGGPLTNGAGTGGTIILVAAALESALAAAFGTSTPEIIGLADAISNHVATGTVTFASGTITGACTNTPTSPGTLTGAGAGGMIVGLSGPTLAAAIASGIGQAGPTSQVTDMSTEIVNHIMNNAVVTLPLVTGVAPSGGGPITGGTAAGGTIA